MRVRMGPITAECASEDVERIGLRRGEPATAWFAPSHARLIAMAA
jgi:hypothetical protein